MRKAIIVATLVLLAAPVTVFGQAMARMTGKVVDQDGNPLPTASINLKHDRTKTFNETFKVGRDGSYAVAVVDGTIEYDVTVSAEGYEEHKESIKMQLVPQKNEREFVLYKLDAAGTVVAERGTDPASAAFNEGAGLFNEANYTAAAEKFNEAVTLNPSLAAGWVALAKVQFLAGNWQKSIDAGEKALGIIIEDDEVHTVLADAYSKLGNNARAEEYRKKLPDNAGALYNDAVTFLNDGNDAAAEPLLKRALKADAKFGPAHYQLGMVYVRMGRNADAKEHLKKYLEIEPNGADAPMATEIMKYLD